MRACKQFSGLVDTGSMGAVMGFVGATTVAILLFVLWSFCCMGGAVVVGAMSMV